MDENDVSRRTFAKGIASALPASAFFETGLGQEQRSTHPESENEADVAADAKSRLQIGMLSYPGLSALDLVGPHAFFAELSNTQVHLLWKDTAPVARRWDTKLFRPPRSGTVLEILKSCLCQAVRREHFAMMDDNEILSFLADRGSRTPYVTGVCTGSLILGAAGLIKGYQATSHWRFRDLLPMFVRRPSSNVWLPIAIASLAGA